MPEKSESRDLKAIDEAVNTITNQRQQLHGMFERNRALEALLDVLKPRGYGMTSDRSEIDVLAGLIEVRLHIAAYERLKTSSPNIGTVGAGGGGAAAGGKAGPGVGDAGTFTVTGNSNALNTGDDHI